MILSTYTTLLLALFCLHSARFVNAGIYVINPAQGSTCRANQPCTITWLDDGAQPLLSAIGVSTVGLYTGRQQLVQAISPVDVSTSRSVTFKPNPAAGPNANSYYIAISSTTLKDNSSAPYTGFSPFFTLTDMTGSFDNPLPAATSPIHIPASLTRPTAPSSTSTIVVGNAPPPPAAGTPLPSPAPAPTTVTSPTTANTSSRMTTSLVSTSTSAVPQTPPANGAAVGRFALSRAMSVFSVLVVLGSTWVVL